jgi:type II secretory pathway predicted ATPase ExeA
MDTQQYVLANYRFREPPMYDRYWGLERQPLARELDRQLLEASPVHSEALARLDFLRDSQLPLGLVIGPSGSGKSSVLREFARRAERSGAVTITVAAVGSDESFVLDQLARGLSLANSDQAWQTWRSIDDRLAELRLEGQTAIVLLDDLDRASSSGQAVVARLLALAPAPLPLVASARAETASRISREIVDQAALRIELAPWTESETAEYLSRSLVTPGRKEPVFNASAAQQLFALSGGAPRKVRQLAELALVAGASQELSEIDAQTVWAVHEELSVAR